MPQYRITITAETLSQPVGYFARWLMYGTSKQTVAVCFGGSRFGGLVSSGATGFVVPTGLGGSVVVGTAVVVSRIVVVSVVVAAVVAVSTRAAASASKAARCRRTAKTVTAVQIPLQSPALFGFACKNV